MEYDFLVGRADQHYSQRNNEFEFVKKGCKGKSVINWTNMCNVTAYCEAAEIINWKMPNGRYKQNEDNFANFIVNQCLKSNNWFKDHYYSEWKKWNDGEPDKDGNEPYTPLNFHDCIAHYFNEWVKCDHAVHFVQNCSISDIVTQIAFNRKPVPTSVRFGNLNHIILLTGVKFEFENTGWNNDTPKSETELAMRIKQGDLTGLKLFKYSDPWGVFNFESNTYDKTYGGWNNIMTYDNFLTHVKDLESKSKKFAHIFDSPMTLV